jgi:tetratricopeptide (TPR) repeat protein
VTDKRDDMSRTVSGALLQARDVEHVSFAARAPVALAGLPSVEGFTGRRPALAELAKALRPADDDGAPVVISAVAGLAGVGKTTLAVRAAHDAVAEGWFPGGVLFVDLQGYDPQQLVTPESALSTFLRALGLPAEHIPAERAGREVLYRSRLAELAGSALIVLDNASSADQVRPLLPGSSAHRVLVTSRHTLGDLAGARQLDLNVLDDEEAVALVDTALRAARPDDDRIAEHPDQARELVGLCGHLPLALSIVAAILVDDRDQPVDELTEALREASRRLGELSYGDSLGVHSAFELSYHRLTPAEARLFRLLSLNPGRQVSVQAAAALADLSVRETAKLLNALRRAHMIEYGEPRGWFRCHDLLRLYSEDRAEHDEKPADRYAAIVRVLDHYAVATRAADEQRNPAVDTYRAAIDWLDTERSTLVDAVVLADRMGCHAQTMRLAFSLGRFLFYRRHWRDCAQTYQLAYAAARQAADWPGVAKAVHGMGKLERELRHHAVAQVHYGELLAICREIGDRPTTAQALHNLGSIARRRSEFDLAIDHYVEALAVYREVGNRRGEADVAHNLGVIARKHRDYQTALEYFGEALHLARLCEDRLRQGRVMEQIGSLASRQHDPAWARDWWGQAVDAYAAAGRTRQAAAVRRKLRRLDR